MAIALCMVVKDEANRIDTCLDAALGAVDEVVIFDTGSTDGTPERLARRYGIRAIPGNLCESRCYTKSDLRNRGYELAKADWILSLDADERIDAAALHQFRGLQHAPDISGYFGAWTNHLAGASDFEDYKLFLFRRGFRKRGLVHENAQVVSQRRVRVVDRLVLANDAAQLLAEHPRARLELLVFQHLVRQDSVRARQTAREQCRCQDGRKPPSGSTVEGRSAFSIGHHRHGEAPSARMRGTNVSCQTSGVIGPAWR